MTALSLRAERIAYRERMAALRQRQATVYPTQRPNGEVPIRSPWFIDKDGVHCRLLCDDALTVAHYVAAMTSSVSPVPDTRPLTPAANAPMLDEGVRKERSCDTGYATGGSKSDSLLD